MRPDCSDKVDYENAGIFDMAKQAEYDDPKYDHFTGTYNEDR